MGEDEPLEHMDDAQLGQLVRATPTFRAAVACAQFAGSARELRENDSLAWDHLLNETHTNQSSRAQSFDTTKEIVETFLDEVEGHAELNDNPEELADEASEEVLDE